jgi:hydrophobic/amphiphilic exporter-1 (mainly G- bacteria), HAE1 family
VLASTLTTLAVFIPIVFVQQQAGQLFRDIAIAISAAVGISLVVAITVIPCASARLLSVASDDRSRRGAHNLWGGVHLAERGVDAAGWFVGWILRSTPRRLIVVTGLTALAFWSSMALLPRPEYLPLGNRNLLNGFVLPPPGYNLDEMTAVGESYLRKLQPLLEPSSDPAGRDERPGGGIEHFFFVAQNTGGFMLALANDGTRVRELLPEMRALSREVPGTTAIVTQNSIFPSRSGEGRNIDVVVRGPDLDRLLQLGRRVYADVPRVVPGAQARPIPSLDYGNPEVHVITDRRRAAQLGLSNRELGFAVAAVVDGAKASEFRSEGKEVDLRIRANIGLEQRTHLFDAIPLATADGRLVTLGAVARIEETSGPIQILHRERQRAITIQVTPPVDVPLGAAMQSVQDEIIAPMYAEGLVMPLEHVTLSGSADKLTETFGALRFNLLLAIVLTYLLMAALFESFLYPLVIMFSVPLAGAGGVMGLALVDRFIEPQPLDVLTMLGFIILVGSVVNNAILIVHQSLNQMREGWAAHDAIVDATRTRIRPIFMTVTTTVFGMAPLVFAPGAGSELYRGLAAVVMGGLIVSTVFTIVVVPAVFSLAIGAGVRLRRVRERLPMAAA